MASSASGPAPRPGLFATAMLGACLLGGAVALAGGFDWAELAGRRPGAAALVRAPWHPWSTPFSVAVSLSLVAAGLPVYAFWKRRTA